MKSTVTGPKSKFNGARCGLCPAPIRAGDSILFKHLATDVYAEDRLVFHTDCMRALVDRAPAGRRVSNPKVDRARIREQVLATGDLFSRVG